MKPWATSLLYILVWEGGVLGGETVEPGVLAGLQALVFLRISVELAWTLFNVNPINRNFFPLPHFFWKKKDQYLEPLTVAARDIDIIWSSTTIRFYLISNSRSSLFITFAFTKAMLNNSAKQLYFFVLWDLAFKHFMFPRKYLQYVLKNNHCWNWITIQLSRKQVMWYLLKMRKNKELWTLNSEKIPSFFIGPYCVYCTNEVYIVKYFSYQKFVED